jgi:type VI secretion system protein ImpC
MGTRIADSFARYRWCPNIIGPTGGGVVKDLPICWDGSNGMLSRRIPAEIIISEQLEFDLSEAGFISLSIRRGNDDACFFSANSVQEPKAFGRSKEAKIAETNYRLGTQLPYMFIMSRLAHYLKVLQRENIGSWKQRGDLERELDRWIKQYVADMDDPKPGVRSRRPLRKADITVEDSPDSAGWYKVELKVVPHMKYMGAFFTLSLVGKLDKD